MPSCSPLSEIRRTERALIWPLILVSSSAATLNHSFRYGLCGTVEPPNVASRKKHQTDTAPTHVTHYTPASTPSSRLTVLRHLLLHAVGKPHVPHRLLHRL